jgi:hypothetical protein
MKCSSQKVSRVLNLIKCEEDLVKEANRLKREIYLTNRFALLLLLIGRVI